MSADQTELERLIKVVIAFSALHCLALATGVSWLVMSPGSSPGAASSAPRAVSGADGPGMGGPGMGGPGMGGPDALRGDMGGPEGRRGGVGGPGAGAPGGFSHEPSALRAYVRSLDRLFTLEILVASGLRPEAIGNAREQALECEQFRCEGALRFLHVARETGKPIPPLLLWGDAVGSEALATEIYVDLITWAADEIGAAGGDAPALDGLELCEDFSCEALHASYDVVAEALAPLEMALPPAPGRQAEGDQPGPGGPGEASGAPER